MTDFSEDTGSDPELDSLLGAYALDALDAEDRARVDEYLDRDAVARGEVDEMRETAASLALAPVAAMDAPPEIWERISQAIASDGPRTAAGVKPGADEVGARRTARARARWMAPVAAAAAIVIVVLAAQAESLRGRLEREHRFGPTALAAAYDRATKVDGAREIALRASSGGSVARLVLLRDGTGYLRADHLTPLAADRTYQLWAMTGDALAPTAISAGVLGPNPRAVGFRASGPVVGFAVTIERAGGVVMPSVAPIAQAALA